MKHQTLAMAAKHATGFERHRGPTRRDEFLDSMNRIVPWADPCAVIEPHYPKRGNGRPPIGLERMLRIHFIQHWFNLADFACEEALYDIASLRHFAGIDLGCEAVPDATTLLKFRRLLETLLGSPHNSGCTPSARPARPESVPSPSCQPSGIGSTTP